jgi:hypothetical protein
MGIFSKIRGGAGESGYPPKKQQFSQPGQAYNPDAVNVFSSVGYKPSKGIMSDKPNAPQNRTYEKGENGQMKTDVWGKAIPAKSAQPQATAKEDDSWLKEAGY